MPNPLRWVRDVAARVFRRAGRIFSETRILREFRDKYSSLKTDWIDGVAERLGNGDITIQRWVLDFRQELKTTYINQYVAARGGFNAMTQQDWGRLGHMLRDQYRYMNNFAADIAVGNLSPEQIKARMQLYFNSSTQAYERGKAAAVGLPQMPAYPGDGQTVCKANCQCGWDYVETDTTWECTWSLGIAEHCPGCVANAAKWSPLVIAK